MGREEAEDKLATDPRVRRLLKQPYLGQLGFNGLDGHPRVAPVWYLYEGGELLIGSPLSAYKNRCLSADNRASFAVATEKYPYHQVTMLADAVVEIIPELKRIKFAERMSKHYLGADGGERYMLNWSHGGHPGDGGLIRLHPSRIHFQVIGKE